MTDVSVVIPTRNRPELLTLALRGALWQEDVAVQVIVVDDGDGPATAALVERTADPRVRLLTNVGPPGVGGARNTGIAAAAGRWVAFLDDDDLWAPGKLAAQVAAAEGAGRGWVYAGDVVVDAALRVRSGGPPPTPEDVVAGLRRHNAVPAGASNVLVRHDLLVDTGGFDPQLRTSEDWDLWLRLAGTGLPASVPRPLVAVRTHGAMASRDVDQMLADIEVVADRHSLQVDWARHERWAGWTCLEDGHRGAAMRHYARATRSGDLLSAARAGVALVAPGVARRRARRPPTGDWAREAQGWLDALAVKHAAAGHADPPRPPR